MKSLSRKAFLRCGAALPLALRALSLKADTPPTPAPRRLVFICNSWDSTSPTSIPSIEVIGRVPLLESIAVALKVESHRKPFPPGHGDQQS